MKRYQIHQLEVAVGALFLAIMSGCKDGPRGPAGAPVEVVPGISASIDVHYYAELTVSASVAVDDAPPVASVLLNGMSTPLPLQISDGIQRFSFTDLPFLPGDSVHLSVNYSNEDGSPAEAYGDIVIPDTFLIVIPDTFGLPGQVNDEYELKFGDSLRVEWLASAGARAYSVWFYLQYVYLDTANTEQYSSFYVDTAITGTSIVFPPEELYPDLAAMDSLLYGTGLFRMHAKCGPALPGDLGNISGDGQGFLNARSEIEDFGISLQP